MLPPSLAFSQRLLSSPDICPLTKSEMSTKTSNTERAAKPKFKHPRGVHQWAKQVGLKWKGSGSLKRAYRNSLFEWEGFGRRFRANEIGLLQIDDALFQKWANSVGFSVPMPQSLLEFEAAIHYLLQQDVTPMEDE